MWNLLKNMLREMSETISNSSDELLCQLCLQKGESVTATIFCSTCDEFQCDECSKGHNIYTFLKNHDLQKSRHAKPLLVGINRCETHKETINFYCEDDDQLCCGTCAFLSHKDCIGVGEISRASRLADTDCNYLTEQFCDLQNAAERARNCLRKSEKVLKEQTEHVSKDIDKMEAKIDMSFEQLSVNTVKEAVAIKQQKTNEISEFQNNCELLLNEIKLKENLITTLMKSGTPSQQFIAMYKLRKDHEALTERVEQEASKIEMLDFEIDFAECDGLLASLLTSVNKQPLTTENLKMEFINYAAVNITDLCADDGDLLYISMDFFQDGRLIAIEHHHKEMLIFEDNLKLIKSQKFIDTPSCLVLVSQTDVAVSLTGCSINMYHISRKNDIILFRSIKTSLNCLCLCLQDNETFAASYFKNEGIKTISFDGREKDMSFKTPLKKFSCENYQFRFLNNMEKIVTSDKSDNTVSIYDTLKNTNVIVKDDRINDPRGMAIGPSNSIFICNKTFSHTIAQISSTGEIIASYNLGLFNPLTMCISADMKKLAITSGGRGKQMLNVYDIRY